MGVVMAELSKTGNPHNFEFSGELSTDIATRARSFQNLVKSGMTVSKAASLSGLVLEDE